MAWTGSTSARALFGAKLDVPFTPMDIGTAIRAAAPHPDDLALLAGLDSDAQLWFYGDRALRTNIWTIDDVQRRAQEASADLVFGFDVQPWDAPASGIVVPAAYRRELADLRTYLARHYPLVALPAGVASKFEVFDLRRPSPGARLRPFAGPVAQNW